MEVFISFMNGLGIMALATGSYALVQRRRWPRYIRHLLLGLVFGIGAAFVMFNTVEVAPGVIVDSRNLFVAFSGAFLGPIGAAASLLVACGTRLMIGGSGAMIGVGSMVIAAFIGLLWNPSSLKAVALKWWRFPVMGLSISLALVVVFLLPAAQRNAALELAVPAQVLFNVIGALIFGAMIERERSLTREQRDLLREVLTDPLTGALNRRGLVTRYREAAALNDDRGAAILVLDLDHFKAVNDRHGHDVGDKILKAVVEQTRLALRSKDSVARLGGEEFAVLLPGATRIDALRVAERVRMRIGEIVLVDCPELVVTASVGVVTFGQVFPELEPAIAIADSALYTAKDRGRNRVEFADFPFLADGI
ncbi:GGDEF domain-containing protein [Wenxinia saemankumensis]|uniref:diguanylate cyclase n=1 Tax=Wenxinia saemankumensis TaxID=1447782 RepID=A0A1M6GK40_9RHOB|nr:diguanylate cyclase [Wenxinia saemankumensis]SHJ10303.1 diguanylate cyclase [Wenxinia saemankumensis]